MSYLLAFLVGLTLGSFLNVVISRLPHGEQFWRGRSRCPQCGATLSWFDNIPLLSFFLLRGRCRFCGAAIPWRYPLVELASGGLALALWAVFPDPLLLLAYGLFAAALLALSAIDLEHYLLPDVITLPGVALGLLLSLALPELSFAAAGAGALLGGGSFLAVGWIYEKLTGRQGIGGGDVKLMAMIGAFLGVQAVPFVVFISALLGSLVGLGLALKSHRWQASQWRVTSLPYGPFLAAAALIYLLVVRNFTGGWWLGMLD